MDRVGFKIAKMKNLSQRRSGSPQQLFNASNRVSPVNEEADDTIVEFDERKPKRKIKNGKKVRRSSSANSATRPVIKGYPRKNFYKVIAQRDCCKYVPEKNVTPNNPRAIADKCCCGLMRHEHKNYIAEPNGKTWTPEASTRPRRTTCYGELEFAADPSNNKQRKNYIRCAHDTDAQKLLDMMKKDWKLKVPNLVISVTGGAMSFYMKPNLKKAFAKGLLKVATSTSAWIITAGTNAGVMQHVGDAFSNTGNVGIDGSDISLLGIAPWGALSGRETLVNPNIGKKHAPAVQYVITNKKRPGLDKNHTHFILVDDGTSGKFGTEINFRSDFEALVAKQNVQTSSSAGKVDVPVVILCLEGGPGTIKTMAAAVNNKTPLVVIGGSGRAADVVSHAYDLLDSDDLGVSFIKPDYIDTVKENIRQSLKIQDNEDLIEVLFKQLKDILKDITLVTVFMMEDDSSQSDLDLAVLQALLKANNISRKVKDKIADFQKVKKSPTFATDLVYFAYETRRRMSSQEDAQHMIKEKVKECFADHDDFIETVYNKVMELLQNEAKVERFFQNGKVTYFESTILTHLLKDIYEVEATKASFQMQLKLALAWNRIDVAKSEIFASNLQENKFESEWLYESMLAAVVDNKFDFVDLFLREGLNLKSFLTLPRLLTLYREVNPNSPFGSFIAELCKWKHLERDQNMGKIDMSNIAHVMEELMGDRFESRYTKQRQYTIGNFDPKKPLPLPEPDLDLFTWAILCNRRELAKLLWTQCEDSIACALMASKLLKKLAERVADDKNVVDTIGDLIDHANTYEQLAVGVLDECRKENDERAQNIVISEQENFGQLSNLDIAVTADNQEFVAHPSCQTLLSRFWMGSLYINTSYWRIVPCIFLPFLIQPLITFHQDVDLASNKEDDEGLGDDEGYENNNYDETDDLNASMSLSLQASRESFNAIRERSDFIESELKETQFNEDTHSFREHFDDINNESGQAALKGPKTLSYFDRILFFYKAPFVKFITNLTSYLIFLLLYTFIICSRFEIKIHPAEYVLHGWVITLIFEEFRQLLYQEPTNFIKKIEFYFTDPWNLVDFISLVAFVVAAAFRYVAYFENNQNYLIVARVIFATDIALFFFRLLQIFLVNRKMGPKIVMIREMLNDLLYFVVILAVFILAYGVAKQAVLYPNTTDLWETFVMVLNRPYWQMYGELFYEDLFEPIRNHTTGGLLCEQENPDDPCPDEIGQKIVPIYMAIYMLMTNILLLNLLIAIFNNTYEKVQENSDRLWKFKRYDVISEYNDRPSFCPPFIVLAHIWFFGLFLFRCCCKGTRQTKFGTLNKSFYVDEIILLRKWEKSRMEAYNYLHEKREADTQDKRVKSILNRVTALSEDLDSGRVVGAGLQPTSARPETRHGGRPSITSNSNVGNLEVRLSNLEKNVDHILEILTQMNQRQGLIMDAANQALQDNNGPSKSRGVSFGSNGASSTPQITTIHTKARLPNYPGNSIVKRFKVPDDKVLWQESFVEYDPTLYTASFVLDGPYWADEDLMNLTPDRRPLLAFNKYDTECKVNRKSHMGQYEVVNKLPRNPYGRTGVIGRGNLGRFGPNHAADPIATRWRRTSAGIEIDNGKRVLEFIAIQRRDNQQWAIPGGMVEPGENVSETLRKEFTEEALAKLDMEKRKRDQLSARIDHLFSNGVEVYKGYVDDPRNTDNAWMETVACNFHDDTGEVFGEFQLKAGDDAQAVRWQRVSGNIPLFASHVGILEQVAKMHNAAFY